MHFMTYMLGFLAWAHMGVKLGMSNNGGKKGCIYICIWDDLEIVSKVV